MPAIDTFTCTRCHSEFNRANMSVYGGLCRECFEIQYVICDNCGRFVNRNYLIGHHSTSNPLCRRCRQAVESTYWETTPFPVSFASYDRIGSTRKFGVEVETSRCPDYAELSGQTIWGCKYDCSIRGREFDSPILYGDEGLAEVEAFLAQAREKGWRVSNACGTHIHIDVRGESIRGLARIAVAYAGDMFYPFWASLVPRSRRDNDFCHSPEYTSQDIINLFSRVDTLGDWGRRCYDYDRYDYVNLTAYSRHKTFEVRLLQGTLNPGIICNWIIAHTRFADWAAKNDFETIQEASENPEETIKRIVGDTIFRSFTTLRNRYRRH